VAGGKYDSPQIGAWSLWQGNLEADLMVVGQDWGTVDVFERFRGVDPPPRWQNENCANSNLVKLLATIGIQIGLPGERQENKVFFTNAILCLKQGLNMQAPVSPEYFHNCGSLFLRPLIEIVNPRAVVVLGQLPYEAVRRTFDPGFRLIPPYRRYVENNSPYLLPGGAMLFAVYHCGAGSTNRNRSFAKQCEDWKHIGEALGK
jgi:DNA polymerase